MKVFNKIFFKDLLFGSVMKFTHLLPEVTPILRLRGWLVKPCFHSCGKNLQVAKDVRISHSYNISIGNDVFLSGGCWILASDIVTIEDEVMLGPYSVIVTGNHTLKNLSYRFGKASREPVTLKRGSWVGAHSVVSKGVILGEGSVLAAGSVATKDIPRLSIAGGVPAKIIKTHQYSK